MISSAYKYFSRDCFYPLVRNSKAFFPSQNCLSSMVLYCLIQHLCIAILDLFRCLEVYSDKTTNNVFQIPVAMTLKMDFTRPMNYVVVTMSVARDSTQPSPAHVGNTSTRRRENVKRACLKTANVSECWLFYSFIIDCCECFSSCLV